MEPGFDRLPPELVEYIASFMRSGRYEDVVSLCGSDQRMRAVCTDNHTDWLALYPEARGIVPDEIGGVRPSLLDIALGLLKDKAQQDARRCALYGIYASSVALEDTEGPLDPFHLLSTESLEDYIRQRLHVPNPPLPGEDLYSGE